MQEAFDTPTAIVASAAALLREQPFDDISYRALGDAVGVSERTVYRQYPTRAHLLASLALWIEQTQLPIGAFTTVEQFRAAVRERFRACDASPAFAFVCARAATASPVAGAEPTFLTRGIEVMVDVCAPTLNRRDSRRITAMLSSFASVQMWARLRSGFGMDADEIGDVVDRAIARAVAPLGVAVGS
ncbi:TetR/AcrR family transcriptional regulator [Microbacterium sp. No. 7]|uniref:TetR/AcrR family transcriptional regulator n=1 Tax=Microbacterium sp. No. 7 TaxID=1714373 RepID=UPI0006D103D3|nr:TetR/AcrR family transcriptional regulator [Microbacterium sp. No. 7]ALJ21559.1 hypothetical protein AOA12_17335 [Microbacterium sp. No. 7]